MGVSVCKRREVMLATFAFHMGRWGAELAAALVLSPVHGEVGVGAHRHARNSCFLEVTVHELIRG